MSCTTFKMDSKTQAELRRQKILANAEARLRKIKRVTLEDVEKESEKVTCQPSPSLLKDFKENEERENKRESPVPEIIDDNEINKGEKETNIMTNGGLGNGSVDKSDDEPAITDNHKYNYGGNSGVNLEPIQNVYRKPAVSQSKKQVCLDSLIFMILGILIRLLYSIGLSSLFLDNILGPFLVVCLPRVILYIKEKPELPLIYSVIILLGVKENRIKMPFRVLCCLRTIVQSLALYLFSFFVMHCVLKELPL